MAHPNHLQQASEFSRFTLETHEMLGLTTLLFMFIHWIWILLPSSDISVTHLLPYTPARWHHVMADIRYLWQQHKLPAVREQGGLSGFVHGLGFLTASAMVLSGLGLYLVLEFGDGADSSTFSTIGSIHGLFGNLMWAYLCGHVLAAAWHQYQGTPTITTMFRS